MWRKGFSSPLIILPIIAVLSTGIIIFLIKFKPANIDFQIPNWKITNISQTPLPELNKQPSAKNTNECDVSYINESQIEGWKIYQNHKQGFEIQVPVEMHHTAIKCSQGGWVLETGDRNDGSLLFTVEDTEHLKQRLKNSKDTKILIDKAPEAYKSALTDFLNSTTANEILLNSEKLLSVHSGFESGYPLHVSHTFLTINSYPAIKYTDTSNTRYAILAENKIFSFYMTDRSIDLLEKIVKSFKILSL